MDARTTYLQAAQFAAEQVAHPAVADRWEQPSALAQMTVGALAGHLARQLFSVQQLISGPSGARPPITLLEHYARSAWLDAGLNEGPNVAIREGAMSEAADGPAALASRTAAAVGDLTARLAAEPADRLVVLPWGPWSLALDDMLVIRTMEIAVHGDDLACSVGLPEISLPGAVADTAAGLLVRLALRRRGQAAVLRALSRAERAPRSIVAF